MRRPPPRSTRTDTLFPYTTLFRSQTNARPSSGPSPCAVSRPNDRAVFQQRLPDILIIHHIERMAGGRCLIRPHFEPRSEEHTSELQSLMRISYAVFCLKKKKYTYPSTYMQSSSVQYTFTLTT